MHTQQSQPEPDVLRARFTCWLEVLVYRARSKYLRKEEHRIKTISLDDLPEEQWPIAPAPVLRETEFDFEEERLARAFSELSVERQKLLTLVFLYDLKPEEAADALIRIKEEIGSDWKDWFVLCRTNTDIQLFQQLFEDRGVPTDTFKQADLTNSDIERKMGEDTLKILTVHSAKGLENKYVMAFNIRAYNDEEARLCYVAATRARDYLMWIKMPPKRKKKVQITSWE